MDSTKKRPELVWILLIILGAVILIAAGFFGYRYYKAKQDEKNKPTATSTSTSQTADPYAGWKTYTNKEIGYTLRYPADWTLKETDGTSEITEVLVKYISIASPSKDSLHFGLQRDTQQYFNISDRTGIGAGEDIPIAEKAGTLLGDTVTPKAHVWEGKVVEYFYNLTGSKCKCDFASWLGLATEIDWTTQGKTYPALDTVNKIFASVTWITPTINTDDPGSAENLNKAQDVAGKYLNARKARDLQQARPYMTKAFADTMTQETFAGVSSPSFGSYTDMNAQYISDAGIYQVFANVHWMLQGVESGVSVWKLDIVRQSGSFLVNGVTGGYE